MPWDDKSKNGGPWAGGGGSGGSPGGGSGGGGGDGGSPWNRPSGGDNGGGGRREGPDLEESLRRMRDRFGNRRNRRGGAGGTGIGPVGFGVIGGLALLAWLLSGLVIVDESSKAAVFRLGRWDRNFAPGLHVHMPWPVETHQLMPASKQQTLQITREGEETLMLTGDESIVAVQFRVVWYYDTANPEHFILNVSKGEDLLRGSAESVMREVVGKSKLNDIITAGRPRIQLAVQEQLQAILKYYNAGITIQSVEIFDAAAPAQVREAFSDVVKASQDAQTARQTAERYANDIVPRAQGQALKLQQDAEAYREQVIADATGQAARFDAIYGEYRKAPQVTRERMYLETMERVLKKSDKLVLDSNSGAVPYLPIERTQKKPEGQK